MSAKHRRRRSVKKRAYSPQITEALARMQDKEVDLWLIYCDHCLYGFVKMEERQKKDVGCSHNISPYTLNGEPCIYYERKTKTGS